MLKLGSTESLSFRLSVRPSGQDGHEQAAVSDKASKNSVTAMTALFYVLIKGERDEREPRDYHGG